MDKKNIQKIFVAVPMQENMMFSWMNDKDTSTYIEQMIIEIRGNVQVKLIEESFQILFHNYETLRSNFVCEGMTKTRQVVLKDKKPEIEYLDYSALQDCKERMNELIKEDRARGFDLMKSCLMRMHVVKRSEDEYTLIWTNHHIILDGWSRSILVKEFYSIYNCLCKGENYTFHNVDNFSDYAKWINKHDMKEGISAWKRYLDGYEQNVSLSTIGNRSSNTYDSKERTIRIQENNYETIKEIAKKNNITINVFFQCIWGVLLQKYSNINDVVFGMVVSGRNLDFERIDSTVGVLINSVPIRVITNEKESFIDLAVRTQQEINQILQYSYVTLTEIQSSIKEVQGLVNHLTAFENYPAIENADSSSGFSIENIYANEQINYDFGITFVPDDTMTIKIRYNNNAFEPSYISKIADHLKVMIQMLMEKPDSLIRDIHYMDSEEEKELLDFGKGKITPQNDNLTLYGLYQNSVNQNANKTALSYTFYFKDMLEDLMDGKLSKLDEERLQEACFKSSKYIYRYESVDLIVDKRIDRKLENIVLYRSRTHKIVALTNVTYDLLSQMDGQYSIGDILEEIKEKNIPLKAWKVINSNSADFELEKVACNGEFEYFVKLLYLLIDSGFLEFETFHMKSSKFNFNFGTLENSSFIPPQLKTEENPKYKPDCRVLLIGDTPGSATTGILYIASYLRRHGVEAYCNWNANDRCNENLKQNILELLNEVKPTIVGISMKWFLHIYRVLEMAKIIKEYSSSIQIVLGGNTASYYSDNVIQEEYIDCIIRGDGELPFLKICEGAEYLPNCTYIKDGEIVKNEITYVQNQENSKDIYLSDLDKIFVYKNDVYKAPYFFIYTGKGCSMNCCYCAGCRETQEKTFNRKLPFMREIQDVRKDIKAMMAYTGVFMYDFDLPNYDSLDYYKDLWDGIDLSRHFCMFYFWKLPSKDFLEMVSEKYKYVYINIDLASLSERHRKQLTELHIVKPQPSDEEIIQCFKSCSQYDNIEITINQIAGLPYFDERDVDASEKMVQYLAKEFPCFHGIDWGRLHAQPGANLAKDAEKYSMHSYASTYEEFLKYSKMNITEMETYPDLSNTFYPFIEFNDDSRNKMISKHYVKINEILEKYTYHDERIPMVYRLSYEELDKRAQAVAGYLSAHKIGPGDMVALLVERSIEQVVCILGVMKVAATYVPIDVSYPDKRKQYILNDCSAKAVLCTDTREFEIKFQGDAISLNEIEWDVVTDIRRQEPSANDIAYIIYTSGTTGNPKGVMVTQNTIAKSIKWRSTEYQLTNDDVVLQLFSYSFDGFLTSMFTPLVSGAEALIIHNEEVNDPMALRDYIRNFGVTHFISVPQLFWAIADAMDSDDAVSLRVVTLAGDKVSKKIIQLTKQLNPSLELVNEYGPTECSVVATIARNIQNEEKVTIGHPIDDTVVYILDNNLNLLSKNCIGEICLGGSRLAVGYVHNEKLTAEKFVHNPFTQIGRLYHTGDMGRWNEDGNIEFIERNDSQVKIRGYRIETGEIEQCLVEIDGISKSVVKSFEDKHGSKYLCAYIVPTMNSTIKVKDVEAILSEKLASYMIPQKIIQINELPITPNGKLDYKKLPNPLFVQDTQVKPATEQEKAVAAIWEEVLGVSNIGVTDSFLTLGGDSIKVMQIISRLQKINIRVKMKDIFKYPTIRSLLSYVEKQKQNKEVEYSSTENSVEFGLTPIQSWFFEQDFKNKNYWNQSLMIYKADGFDEQICNKCLKDLILGNSALRTKFICHNGEYVQKVLSMQNISAKVYMYDMRQCEDVPLEIKKEAESLQSSLDINQGIVIKVGLFKTNKGDHLLFTIHHLVVDGVSLRILLEKFYSGYKRYQNDGKCLVNYANETFSYNEWYMTLKDKTKDWAPKQFNYWKETVQTTEKVFQIGDDYNSSYSKYGYLECEQNDVVTTDLLKGANEAYHTEANDLLLSALALTINSVYGCNESVINLEGHGRHEAFIDKSGLTQSVGWYTCSYPFLLHADCEDLGKLIKTTKENLRRVREIDVSYGMLRYMGDEKYHQINYEPQIGFNYLGQIDHEVENDLFSLSKYSFGSPVDIESTRPYVIDFSLKIVSGKLQIKLNYNKCLIANKEAEMLMRQYSDSLKIMIEYCKEKEKPELTPSDLGDVTLSEEEIQEIMKVTKEQALKVFPLSPTQEGMMFHNLLEHHSHTYFQQVSFNLCGKVNPQFVKEALEATFMKHESLRTKIIYKGMRNPRQVVVPYPCVDYQEINMVQLTNEQQFIWLEEFLKNDCEKGFVIDGGNLTRITVIEFAEHDYRIVWSFHHMLMDGWCIGLLVKDFLNLYQDIASGRDVYMNPSAQYSDYIKWITTLETDKMQMFWKKYLHGVNSLDGMIPTNTNTSYSLNVKTLLIDEATTSQISQLAKENNATLNTLFEVIWALTISIMDDKTDVIFGAVYSGRNMELDGIENVIGLHINTIPVRISFAQEERVVEVLKKIQTESFELEENQFLSLTEIARASSLENPLYDHIIVFENYPLEGIGGSNPDNQSIWIGDKINLFEQTNYNFNITVVPEEKLIIKFKYNQNAFEKAYIEKVLTVFNKVLNIVKENIGSRVKDIKEAVVNNAVLEERHLADYKFESKLLSSIYRYFLPSIRQEADDRTILKNGFSILDRDGKQVSDGIVGKLCFELDSFSDTLSEYDLVYDNVQNCWCNSGLLVRVLDDHRIQFIAMDENHVVLDDNIYNLLKIEHKLAQFSCIRDKKAVIYHNKNVTYLVIYLVLNEAALPRDFQECVDGCQNVYYVRVGKIPEDISKCADIINLKDSVSDYVAPESELQKLLANEWAEILGVNKVGITDNFFELNGDSIKALRLVSRLYSKDIKLDIKDLFVYPAIVEIEKKVEMIESVEEDVTDDVELLDESDISAIKALMEN